MTNDRKTGAERAKCPCFRARVDYKGRSYIQCCGSGYRFRNPEERDRQYRLYCCCYYRQCNIYLDHKTGGENNDGTGEK